MTDTSIGTSRPAHKRTTPGMSEHLPTSDGTTGDFSSLGAAPAAGGREAARDAASPPLFLPAVLNGAARPASPPAPGPPPGLVICAISGREDVAVPDAPPGIREVWAPEFPRSDLVALAAGQFRPLPSWQGEEGPRFRIVISPGTMAVESRDLAKAERTYERTEDHRQAEVEMVAAYIAEHGVAPPDPLPVREITEWSRRSRARMFRAFCELDYGPLLERDGIPAMVTLTYPGDWLTVAPDGKTAKKQLKAFRKRWERAWGLPVLAVWKQEHQARGAPHYHLFTVVPDGRTSEGKQFREWLSQTWAEVVNHPDPEEFRKHLAAGTGVDYAAGLRARDPRRIAVYFSKHGLYAAKEYQNEVPEEWQEPGKGPGRFWGVWGLKRCARAIEVDPRAATLAARVMRRWAAAQDVTREVRPPRYAGGHHLESAYPDVIGLAGAQLVEAYRPKHRRVRRRAKRMQRGRGWISLNDGPAFALEVARYLEQRGYS